ncbi:anion permease [Actinomyces bowdenii]|uniref:SLC13 family permease n=1 Tax=Actinomyces bowdenii TaxID=131109 RepID=A0A3P1V6F2_9ACTO|nr:SLC13 family permease [Actinomyces bowdenii]MBO3723641.1 anion permease [Actinomyces bowdenii]RRD29060.1 SLC13 family permease [Actinomyces bowdenii]
MTILETLPLSLVPDPEQEDARGRSLPWGRILPSAVALALCLGVAAAHLLTPAGPSVQATITLIIFITAVWAWAFTRVDDTYVSLGAGTALVLSGSLSPEDLFSSLGDDTIWLLVAAFVIAVGVTASGLTARAAAWLVTGTNRPRVLFHLITAAIVGTVFAAPSTSGRAALLLPVFVAIAKALRARPQDDEGLRRARARLVHALSLLFPTVILLSAVGSFLGAGAHLVTAHIVASAGGREFSFASWLLLGLPLAALSSHLAAELILALFTKRSDMRRRVSIDLHDLAADSPTPLTGPLTQAENRAALLLGTVVVLWCTESLHGVDPAIVALVGVLVTALPGYGAVSLKKALSKAPWSLLVFMAATLAMGDALVSTGAAQWVASTAFTALSISSPWPFMVAVVLLSTAAHLVIQSRSARSAVLVPIVVALAPAVGVDPAAAAFASTAAAGFCHTLPSSAKPVAMFASAEEIETFTPADLRRLSLILGPVTALLVLACSAWLWPLLGLSW